MSGKAARREPAPPRAYSIGYPVMTYPTGYEMIRQDMARSNVVIGLIGSTVDQRGRDDRWRRWRPTVSICQHATLPIDRFELLAPVREKSLVRQITADIAEVSPRTDVRV